MQLTRLLFLSVLLAGPLPASAAEDSAPVTLAQTPPAVRKTIAAQIGDGTLGEIDRADENGDITFDVDFTSKSGDEHGFSVAADGTLLSTEVALADTPPAVRKTIQTQAGGWELDSIDKNVEETGNTFDVEATSKGQTQDFTVDDDGTLLSVAVALADTPLDVQKAIQTQASGWEVESIDKNVDDPDVTYDVQAAKGGVIENFTLDDDGTLISMEVPLSQTPQAVQATIQSRAGTGRVESIDRNIDPTGDTFDVETVSRRGVRNSFTVGLDGTVQSQQITLDQTPLGARATIMNEIGNGKIIRIDRSFVDRAGKGPPLEVEGRKNGLPFDFSVAPKGRFLGMDQ